MGKNTPMEYIFKPSIPYTYFLQVTNVDWRYVDFSLKTEREKYEPSVSSLTVWPRRNVSLRSYGPFSSRRPNRKSAVSLATKMTVH